VLRSEWIRLRTLRSTFVTLAAATGSMIGSSLLFTGLTASHWSATGPAERATLNPTALSLIGFFLAQLAVGVLGVLVVTGEYSTGMMRATLSAVPRRLPVLWARAAVYPAVTCLLLTAASVAAFLAGQAVLSTQDIGASLHDPGVTRAVLGTGLYLTVVALLSVGIGMLVRNTAAGTATVIGLLVVIPGIAEALPRSWADHINPYLPSNAGHALVLLRSGPHTLAPWTGFVVFCLYAVAALAAAAVALTRRDA
jgi:ABC-type transport system involved in multi-copper enzyme maturation permease subunit